MLACVFVKLMEVICLHQRLFGLEMRFGVGDKVGESGKEISTPGFAGALEQRIYGVETEAKIVVHGFSGGDGRARGYRSRSRRRC